MSSQNVWVTKVTDAPRPSTSQRDILGSIRWIKNKCYKCVDLKLVPTADVDAVAGDALVYTDYSADEVGVDIGDMEANLPAGIATGAIDMSVEKGYRVWIQIKGPATLSTSPANGGAGQMFDAGSAGHADKVFALWVSTSEFLPAGVEGTGDTEASLTCPY